MVCQQKSTIASDRITSLMSKVVLPTYCLMVNARSKLISLLCLVPIQNTGKVTRDGGEWMPCINIQLTSKSVHKIPFVSHNDTRPSYGQLLSKSKLCVRTSWELFRNTRRRPRCDISRDFPRSFGNEGFMNEHFCLYAAIAVLRTESWLKVYFFEIQKFVDGN